jgi:hypothetical protein
MTGFIGYQIFSDFLVLLVLTASFPKNSPYFPSLHKSPKVVSTKFSKNFLVPISAVFSILPPRVSRVTVHGYVPVFPLSCQLMFNPPLFDWAPSPIIVICEIYYLWMSSRQYYIYFPTILNLIYHTLNPF